MEPPTFIDSKEIIQNYEEIKKQNITRPILSKYERTKILGLRAEQLARGFKPLISVPSHITETIDIAMIELEQRKIPYIIKRKFGEKTDYWKVEDLNY